MVTFAQAQERAEEWINGDLPAYQHREVRVREFGLGFVVWAEDREGGPTSDGGRQRLVIARDSGEATLWPSLPVGEVIRRYEEEYGATDEVPAQAAVPAARIDLNQTSFLLSPPEWLQDAADKIGLPREESHASQESASASGPVDDASDAVGVGVSGPSASVASSASSSASSASSSSSSSSSPSPSPSSPSPSSSSSSEAATAPVPGAPAAPVGEGDEAYEPTAMDGVPASTPASAPAATPPSAPAPAPAPPAAPAPSSPWVDANASSGGADGAVPLPATVFAPALSGTDDEDTPPLSVGADAPTALMHGGSALP
ncbi:SUKH-4 family immunity protein, partial [Streptomyces sp. NPDC004290]